MKKKYKIMIIISIIVLLPLVFFLCFVIVTETVYNNVIFADSVIIQYDGHFEEEHFITEANIGDKKILKKMFSGLFAKNQSSRCSGSSYVSITFLSNNKTLIIYPAGDGCNQFTVVYNERERYFSINENDFLEVQEMLRRYGVVWAFDR